MLAQKYGSTCHAFGAHRGQKAAFRTPRTRETGRCKSPCGYLGLNLDPLQLKQILSSTELSL